MEEFKAVTARNNAVNKETVTTNSGNPSCSESFTIREPLNYSNAKHMESLNCYLC